MSRWIYRSTAALIITVGLIANSYQLAGASDQTNTWKTVMDLQQPEIGRCNLSSQLTHHNLSLNGLESFVITVHKGPDITYELLVDQKLFLGELRLPARAFDRIFVFGSATSQSLLDAVISGKVLTLVEKYSQESKELRHDFMLEGFNPAYLEFERCLAKT